MNKQPSILLVEDEQSLSDVIQMILELENYKVRVVADGEQAIDVLDTNRFDLVILDIMLPTVDGFEICEHIRKTDNSTQILIMSAKDSSADKIKGLKLGADDYLPKPFDLEELKLRVQSLFRRNSSLQQVDTKVFEFGKNSVNFNTFTANNGTESFQLTKREADLLEMLIEKEGEVVSRDEILKRVWGYDVLPNTRTIDNFILAFRKYFETNPKQPIYFHSVWGVGYRFTSK